MSRPPTYLLSTEFLRRFLAQGGTGDGETDQMIRGELDRRAMFEGERKGAGASGRRA